MARQYNLGGQVDEVGIVNDFLKRWRLPPFVRKYEVEIGEDSSGEPALWISFYVDNDLKPSKQKLTELKDLTDSIVKDLIAKNPRRWPYIRFRDAA